MSVMAVAVYAFSIVFLVAKFHERRVIRQKARAELAEIQRDAALRVMRIARLEAQDGPRPAALQSEETVLDLPPFDVRRIEAEKPWTPEEREALGINDTERWIAETAAELDKAAWEQVKADAEARGDYDEVHLMTIDNPTPIRTIRYNHGGPVR